MKKAGELLHNVARLYNVQTVHHDGLGRLTVPPPEAVLAVLRMLGAPVERMEDLAGALRQRREFLWRRGIEPVVVAWNGAPLRFKLRLPSQLAEAQVGYRLALENGDHLEGTCHDDHGAEVKERYVEGTRYVTRRLILPAKLPFGYHRLHLQAGARAFESHLMAALPQAYGAGANGWRWGLCCPAYALASRRNWGAGDISDLKSLVDIAGELGGAVVGTLPLLSTFLDQPFNPSPYAPVSRLFWNEFYLDVERIPEFQRCPAVKTIISSGFVTELEGLRAARLIDYRRLMALKRRVLEELLRCLLDHASDRRASFERYVATNATARDYASFRAKLEREGKSWQYWPARARDGTLSAGDHDPSAEQYHLYVQWLADEQLQALAERAKTGGLALYLDFPLGVNRDGYDVWRERALFALDASGGAPPDGFFTKGQSWGFPPLHPEAIRQQGYRYYVNCLRHHLRYARMLRIDHVMGLHRLYWISRGGDATEGIYVHYRAEEFYAILSLESHRHQTQIIGENLGTVPPYVNAAMAKHGLFGMYVGQFGVGAGAQNALAEISPATVVSLNTHDTATFAGFLAGDDIRDRLELGLLAESQAVIEHNYRAAQKAALIRHLRSQGWLEEDAPDAAAILKAWLCYLSASGADLVLINVEDLWLEPRPQNVPGTWDERPNWKRKARHSLEELRQINSVMDILVAIDQTRRGKR